MGEAGSGALPNDELDAPWRCRDPGPGRLASVRRAGRAQFVRALQHTSLDIAARRAALPDRAERLRQEHAAQHHRRPADADDRHGRGRRQDRCAGPMPHDIAFVFQENALFPWCTVVENVKLGMVFQGVPKAEREPRARQGARSGRARRLRRPLSRRSFPAACASARRWPARSAWRPACC